MITRDFFPGYNLFCNIAPSSGLFFVIVVESGVIRFCLAPEQAIHLGMSAFKTLVVGWIIRRTSSPFSSEPRDDYGLARMDKIR
jgi:hypothetical protein